MKGDAHMALSRWLFTTLLVLAFFVSPLTSTAAGKPPTKNVIVMICDGCGYNHVDAASLYQYGQTGAQVYEQFPVRYAVSTYSSDGHGYDPTAAWTQFEYVESGYTDSAAAATAMATGVKTYDAGIGVDSEGNPVANVVEKAEQLGKSTGVVTTVEVSHATPAGFVAHNDSRDHYAEIAQEMFLTSAVDVIMGAGNPWFDNNAQPVASPNTHKYVGGESTWESLVAGTAGGDADGDGEPEHWSLIQERSQFQALMLGDTPPRVAGIAQAYTTLQQARSEDPMAGPYEAQLNEGVPTLAEMTKGALNVLDNNPDGFFLMVEGGAVDWAAHANQGGRTVEEMIDFSRAVEAVVEWVETNSNWGETLLVVTADHETGYVLGPGSNPTWERLVNNGAGVMPGVAFYSTNHTNSLVPIFAKGAAARLLRRYADEVDPVRGRYLDNTEIGKVLLAALQ